MEAVWAWPTLNGGYFVDINKPHTEKKNLVWNLKKGQHHQSEDENVCCPLLRVKEMLRY